MSSFEPQARSGPEVFVPDAAEAPARGFVRQGAEEAELPEATAAEVAEPEIDPAALRQAAYDEGYRAGVESHPWREAKQLEGALAALGAAAKAVLDLERDYLGEHRKLAVELSLAIAESVLQRAVEADPEALAALIERAIEPFSEADGLCVSLAPADLETLEAGESDTLGRLRETAGLRFAADAELAAGEFRVDGERSRVEGRRQELIRRVRDELFGTRVTEEATR